MVDEAGRTREVELYTFAFTFCELTLMLDKRQKKRPPDAGFCILPVIVSAAVSDPTSSAPVLWIGAWMGANEVWVTAQFNLAELPHRLRRYIPAA
jgi:hypothetical protein